MVNEQAAVEEAADDREQERVDAERLAERLRLKALEWIAQAEAERLLRTEVMEELAGEKPRRFSLPENKTLQRAFVREQRKISFARLVRDEADPMQLKAD